MINIIYTVLLFNILIIFFKLFEKYNVDNIQALTSNYATAALFCWLFLSKDFNIANSIHNDWI